MKKRLFYFALLIMAVASVIAMPAASLAAIPPFESVEELETELPDQVTLQITGYNICGPTYFQVIVSGGTILDDTYDGWCLDSEHQIATNLTPYTANVYSSYGIIPSGLFAEPGNLDLVNWVLNQDYVGKPSSSYGDYTSGDVQRAIWELIGDPVSTYGVCSPNEDRIDEIVAAAQAHDGYEPGCGDSVLIILVPLDDLGRESYIQLVGITVPLVCSTGGEGFTPGFWKNHWDAWEPTGYSPDDDFDATFGVVMFPDTTLDEALRLKGGGCKALARHAVAALLNAAHPNVDYEFTETEVIQMVQDAADGGDCEAIKDILEEQNELEGDISE